MYIVIRTKNQKLCLFSLHSHAEWNRKLSTYRSSTRLTKRISLCLDREAEDDLLLTEK